MENYFYAVSMDDLYNLILRDKTKEIEKLDLSEIDFLKLPKDEKGNQIYIFSKTYFPKLKEIRYINNESFDIEENTFENSNIEKAIMSVKELHPNLFLNAKNLKEVILDDLVKIDISAFAGTSVEEITIPTSCQELNISDFNLLPNLKKINFSDSIDNLTIHWHDVFETKENLTKKANAIFEIFGEETFLKISKYDPKIFLYLSQHNLSKNFYKTIKKNSKNYYIKTLKNEISISTANRAYDTYKDVLKKIKQINKNEENKNSYVL